MFMPKSPIVQSAWFLDVPPFSAHASVLLAVHDTGNSSKDEGWTTTCKYH